MKRVVILGATGSVGKKALKFAEKDSNLDIIGISAYSSYEKLENPAKYQVYNGSKIFRHHNPKWNRFIIGKQGNNYLWRGIHNETCSKNECKNHTY